MSEPNTQSTAVLMGGVPEQNNSIYHRVRFLVGDPVAVVIVPDGSEAGTTLIVRDIELQRARQYARADRVLCPADLLSTDQSSGDRETDTARAAATWLKQSGISQVRADRTLPLLFADVVGQAGIAVSCDPELGVYDRRAKDVQEIEWLTEAQNTTEEAIEMACRMIAGATADADGVLQADGSPLTSERVRRAIDVFLLERGYANPPSIVNGGPSGADCHDRGSGPLRTEQPIVIDVFPRNRITRYYGDCTRTVVHGRIDSTLEKMHAAVVRAKAAAIDATREGVTGQQVHEAAIAVINEEGYRAGPPQADAPDDDCAMVHGTGHGVGLDVHEPPLLDHGGPPLVYGDCLTIEPGLYSRQVGGIRVEDMVIVMDYGCENLNNLQEGLDWS